MRNNLLINEQFATVDEYLKNKSEPDGLMKLISNPKFEFDVNLSSRMLNYHEKNGFIRFDRENRAGKRRFSLINALGYKFSIYLKKIGLSNKIISQLIELLNEKDEKGISDWDKVVFLGAATLGKYEVWVKKNPHPIPGFGRMNEIEIDDKGNEDCFHLSKELRDTFFNEDGNMLSDKIATFLPELALEIQKVRSHLDKEILKHDNINIIAEPSVKYFASSAIMDLNKLPLSEYSKMYDIIHRDEKGNHFGIQIKSLKINPKSTFKMDKLTTNNEELKKAIEDELKFLQKMMNKLDLIV
jgi:DNA-binding transcriptional MerR regulator